MPRILHLARIYPANGAVGADEAEWGTQAPLAGKTAAAYLTDGLRRFRNGPPVRADVTTMLVARRNLQYRFRVAGMRRQRLAL